MNFIKKIFENIFDEDVHRQFLRFGKGEFEKAYVALTKGAKNFKVKTSFEFATDFVGMIAENAKEDLQVNGQIIASYDFQTELAFDVESFKKRGKLYTATINSALTPLQLREIYSKFKNHALLLNINSNEYSLKVGKSLPKPGKAIKDNFCSATLPISLLDEFAFDVKKEFKQLKIVHKYKIDEIIIPEQYKNNPLMGRIHGKRKGTIIRIIEVDGAKEEKTKQFVV